jgi:hypothetical protein
MYLGGTHGGLESRESVVEGAENGDHAFRVRMALLQRVPDQRRPLRQRSHRRRKSHPETISTTLDLDGDNEMKCSCFCCSASSSSRAGDTSVVLLTYVILTVGCRMPITRQ